MADVRPNYAMSIDCANEMEDEVAKTAIKQIKRNQLGLGVKEKTQEEDNLARQ